MTQHFSVSSDGQRPLSFTLRDFAAIGFRRKRVLAFCFGGILLGVMLAALVVPTRYRAETKLLVKKGRLDPVVTPEQTAPVVFRDTVTEEELNSEVELIVSEDLLRNVVLECGLDHRKSLFGLGTWQKDDARIAKAVRRLREELGVELIKKTNLISISYESESPELAARVLRTLSDAYIQKHVEVHHPEGQEKFFEQETEQYRKALADAEQRLKEFSDQQGGVAPTQVRDLTLQKLTEFNGTLASTRTEMAGTEKRIQDLESQQKSTPSRLTTQMKKGDNAQVLEALKNTLMTLELKRTELLTKYQPTYPLVTEVDTQIADTKAALAKEETSPVSEETTDQNPTYQWINSELAKAKADLSGLQARQTATQAIVNLYANSARALDEKGLLQQDLLRAQKANEESYLLYQKKREEARIASALDQTRILNVVITEPPSVPALPSRSPWVFAMVGCLLACVLTAGLAVTLDYADQSLRTPSEVSSELKIPLLAAVPYHPNRKNGLNGKNGHNGLNGKNGKNGKNGNNGSHGDNGFQTHGISGTRMEAGIGESDATSFSDKH
jgi:uncharacterized protein involved in exopolysaccharide biosynthesis